MKKILLVYLIVLTGGLQTVMGQATFYVLNVKGTVKVKKSGAVLKINDQISDKDILNFSTPNDAVAVISTKSGRMVLKPKKNPKSSELSCVISEILNPGTARLSARAGIITNVLDLKNYFEKDSINLLGPSKAWISPAAFPMDQNNFFFVRYTLNGEVVNKKLSFEKDSLILDAQEIYKVDGKPVAMASIKDAHLMCKQGTSVIDLCSFTIGFPDEKSVKDMVMTFKKNTPYKGEEFLLELYPLLKDTYGGNSDKENVKYWLKKNIGNY